MIPSKHHRLQSWLVGALLPVCILALGLGGFLALGTQQPKKVVEDASDPRVRLSKMPIVSIDRIGPFQGIDTLDVQVAGTVVPYRQITLASEIAGRVVLKSEDCRIGQYVHAGDVLFKIDPKDYELEVERLTALKESEYAQQRELDQELSNTQRSQALAEEELALQEKELARVEALPKGFTSENEVDQVRRQRLARMNQLLTVQNQLRLLESRRTRMQLAERLASAQLDQALVNLERCEIKAPISGVIITESVQQDSYVQKGAALCLIEDTERVEVSCSLKTDQLLLILDQDSDAPSSEITSRVMRSSSYELPKTSVEISYRVAGREDIAYQWSGHLSRYEGLGLDAQSRTVPVRITVDNPREVRRNGELIAEDGNGGLPALVRGMFVDVSIQTRPQQSLMLIPKLALKPGGQVWRFDAEPIQDVGTKETLATALPPGTELPSEIAGMRLEAWQAGRLRVVAGIKTIRLVALPRDGSKDREGSKDAAEYWIAEVHPDLAIGAAVITSPLANLIGDGSDRVRYTTESSPTTPSPISTPTEKLQP